MKQIINTIARTARNLGVAITVSRLNCENVEVLMNHTPVHYQDQLDEIIVRVLPEFSTRVIAALEKGELVVNDWSLNRSGVVLRLHRIVEGLFDGERIEEHVFYDVERALINGAMEALNC